MIPKHSSEIQSGKGFGRDAKKPFNGEAIDFDRSKISFKKTIEANKRQRLICFYTCLKSMENQSQVFCLPLSNVSQDRAHKFYLWVKKYRFNLVFTCADSENSVREGPEFDISVFYREPYESPSRSN